MSVHCLAAQTVNAISSMVCHDMACSSDPRLGLVEGLSMGAKDQGETIGVTAWGEGPEVFGVVCLQAVRRVLGRMHAREQEVSNALAETATFVMHHLQVSHPVPKPPRPFLNATLVDLHYVARVLQ